MSKFSTASKLFKYYYLYKSYDYAVEFLVNVQNRSDSFDRHFLVRLGLLKVR